MAFWSSQKLEDELRTLISPFDPSAVEQASYTLKIGNEIFVTKDHRNFNDPHTKIILSSNQDFVIPPGQFAFLLTEESVKVPKHAIAFISIRASFKHKGLVNISGFHVDPGFHGHLLFSVYNAGPTPIHLNQGLPFFLIWYANLDQEDSKPRKVPGYPNIPINVLNQISTDEIYSLQALTKEFREVDSKVSQKIAELDSINKKIESIRSEADKSVTILKWVGSVVITVIVGTVIYFSSSIISVGKFAIEQHEILTNIMEYKKVLDELVKEKNNSQKLPISSEKSGDSKK